MSGQKRQQCVSGQVWLGREDTEETAKRGQKGVNKGV